MGGAEDPHIGVQGLHAAEALEGPLLDDPEQLGLEGGVHLPDLVEEEGAPVRELEAPELARRGAGEGAALVAEHLRLEQPLGDAGAVDRDEGSGGPRALLVDRLGDELFARAALATDQDGDLGVDGVSQGAQHRAHLRGARDDARRAPRLVVVAPGPRRRGEVEGLEGRLDRRSQALGQVGLLEELERAVADRLQREIGGAVAGEEDHRVVGREPLHLAEHVAPAGVGQPHVEHDDALEAVADLAQGGLGRVGLDHVTALVGEELLDHGAHYEVVVDDQHPGRSRRHR